MNYNTWRFTDQEIAHLAFALGRISNFQIEAVSHDGKIMGHDPLPSERLKSLYRRLEGSLNSNKHTKDTNTEG